MKPDLAQMAANHPMFWGIRPIADLRVGGPRLADALSGQSSDLSPMGGSMKEMEEETLMRNFMMLRRTALALLVVLAAPQVALAQEAEAVSLELFTVNNTWMLVATFLVFIMHLGFACLESGLTQAKNTVNILFKNTAIVAIGLVTYAFVGFNLMYPGEFSFGGLLRRFRTRPRC